MSAEKVNTLSIYLVKKGFEIGDDAIDDDGCINLDLIGKEQSVEVDGERIGRLFTKEAIFKHPRWAKIFEDVVPPQVFGKGCTPSAVMIMRAGKHEYAITFGQGRYLLRPESIEEQFGLRVALNILNVKALRSLDKRSFDTISKQSREQASKEVDVKEFGIDIEQDLLRSITGVPADASFGLRVSGMDPLKVSVRAGLADLPALLNKYQAAYKSDSYKENFAWVDHLSEVRNPEDKKQLDDSLVELIESADFSRCWLAAPDIIDWSLVAGFKYQQIGDKEIYHDIGWDTFISALGDQSVTLELLREKHIACLDGDDGMLARWTVYKCVYCEIEKGDKTFLLSNGRWYRVDTDFATQINKFYAGIPRSKLVLPDYSQKGEGEYNEMVGKADSENCACMDRKLVGRVEFCDLFFKTKALVHVKRYGASSSLSHLFAQGLVSGQLFVSDEKFRRDLNRKLPKEFKLEEPSAKITPSDYEIVFAIISDQKGDDLSIPFFSRLNLRHAARVLEGYGYKVSLLKIKVEQGDEKE